MAALQEAMRLQPGTWRPASEEHGAAWGGHGGGHSSHHGGRDAADLDSRPLHPHSETLLFWQEALFNFSDETSRQ